MWQIGSPGGEDRPDAEFPAPDGPAGQRAAGGAAGERAARPHPDRGGLLVGIGLADGRRVASGGVPRNDPDLVWQSSSASSGDRTADQEWWLSPLPPDGPLTFVVRCPGLGIEETATELDGTAIRAAAAGVVELWPWTPPRPWNPEPPPPDLPPGSWFAGP